MGAPHLVAVTMCASKRDESNDDPSKYVEQNRDQLIDIIRHSDDEFVRALCISAIYEYGSTPAISEVIDDLERIEEDYSNA